MAVQPDSLINVYKTDVAPVIDGVLDSTWVVAQPLALSELDQAKDAEFLSGESIDYGAWMRIMWDDENLYIFADMMDDQTLSEQYHAVLTSEDTVESRLCWQLELIAKSKDISYHMRRIWVDKERFVPLKQELYAKSGKLLKRLTLTDVEKMQGRWFPQKMIFRDMLKKGKGTEFIIDEIKFNVSIPESRFSKSVLRD